MGALEAMDGILLFGISTTYIFTVMKACWAVMIRSHLPAGCLRGRGPISALEKIYRLADALG
jgi:hypothetical protein